MPEAQSAKLKGRGWRPREIVKPEKWNRPKLISRRLCEVGVCRFGPPACLLMNGQVYSHAHVAERRLDVSIEHAFDYMDVFCGLGSPASGSDFLIVPPYPCRIIHPIRQLGQGGNLGYMPLVLKVSHIHNKVERLHIHELRELIKGQYFDSSRVSP